MLSHSDEGDAGHRIDPPRDRPSTCLRDLNVSNKGEIGRSFRPLLIKFIRGRLSESDPVRRPKLSRTCRSPFSGTW